jgi:very-short-patch-repair endonuclease
MWGSKAAMSPSIGEQLFALHCRLELTEQPEREFKFHPTRGWRVDFAWPDRKLAVEIESSVHRIKNRFASDIPKYNALQLNGWTLFRFTAKMVVSAEAIDTVKTVLSRSTHP